MTEPTTRAVAVNDDIMDFSSPRQLIKFRVDGDVFEATPTIAAELALDYAGLMDELGDTVDVKQQKDLLHALFRMILLPESADLFIARLSDQRNPIGNEQIQRITQWLFSEYGMRPTTPDSASSTGSESQDAGTSSTVTTPVAALTSGA